MVSCKELGLGFRVYGLGFRASGLKSSTLHKLKRERQRRKTFGLGSTDECFEAMLPCQYPLVSLICLHDEDCIRVS